ncbi:MAG: hypothetical protein QXG00_08415 [Candidatus Woesearchaeota archaeon]
MLFYVDYDNYEEFQKYQLREKLIQYFFPTVMKCLQGSGIVICDVFFENTLIIRRVEDEVYRVKSSMYTLNANISMNKTRWEVNEILRSYFEGIITKALFFDNSFKNDFDKVKDGIVLLSFNDYVGRFIKKGKKHGRK